jgi:hypothetical protein
MIKYEICCNKNNALIKYDSVLFNTCWEAKSYESQLYCWNIFIILKKILQKSCTVRLRFWQLVGATRKVLPKPDNERKIAKNSKTIFMG